MAPINMPHWRDLQRDDTGSFHYFPSYEDIQSVFKTPEEEEPKPQKISICKILLRILLLPIAFLTMFVVLPIMASALIIRSVLSTLYRCFL